MSIAQAFIFPPDAENPKIQPLFSDLPLGARILTTLANANYKTKKMKLWVDDEDKERGMLELKVDVVTPAYERQGGGMIYLPDNSLVKCSVPCGVSGPLFGVAATTLDLQGGAMRAEGVTLLPVGDAWLAKAHLSFGLPSDVKLPRHEADLCRTICEASDAVGEAMQFQPAITRLIDELFGFDVSPAPRDFKLKARQRPIFSSDRGSVSDASRRSKGDGSETKVGKENKKQAAKAKKQMEEWEAVVEKESGDTYFWNKRTGETTWETPAGLDVGKKPPPEPTTRALDDSAELEQFVESLPITAVQKVWMREMMRREEIGGVEMLQLMDEQAWAQVGAKLGLSSKVQRALGQWQTGETKMARQTKTPEQVGEWEAIVEKESGDTYFWNTRTGETTWEKPASTTTAKKTKPNAKAKARAKKVKAKGFHHDGRS